MQTAVASFRDLGAARHAVDRLVEAHFPTRDIHMRTTHGGEEIEISSERWLGTPCLVGAALGAIAGLVFLAAPSGSFIEAHPVEFVIGSAILVGFSTSWFALFYWRVAPKVPRRLKHAAFDVYVDVPPERASSAEHLLAALGGSNVHSEEHHAGSA
jgi:hypothetical protein